ncbi:MAG TPA: serine hydrolase [Puia sp.]|jgi:CubicO group peptidase (beta-lactamase class C family)
MKIVFYLPILLFTLNAAHAQSKKSGPAEQPYFPPRGQWQHRSPASLGLDSSRLRQAIAFAQDNESRKPRDQHLAQAEDFGREPNDGPIGPIIDREDPTGIIIYKGYLVAEWGQPLRIDMTNSVTKSFLSAVVGVAVDQGLIRNVMDAVYPYIPPIEVYNPLAGLDPNLPAGPDLNLPAGPDPDRSGLLYPFSTPHNKLLTWDVMLRQTSDWEGTLWGKADWADRPGNNPKDWTGRTRNTPGTVWKYNDVRVNVLALAATCVWRKPLPQVLKTYIMDPIGASNTWRWNGYRNAWIVLDGQPVQSVSGGGHWGGGMFINAFDMGRFGLLTLHRGVWDGHRLLSEQWVKQSLTPTPANPGYGYMNWFLNTDHKLLPSAPLTAFVHIGNGTNMIYVDPEHDLVAVVRWIENSAMDGMVKEILEALPKN